MPDDHERLVFNNSRVQQVKKRETEKNSNYKSWFPLSFLLYLCEYFVLCARWDFDGVTNSVFFVCSLVLHIEFKSSDHHQRLVFNYSRVDQVKNKKTEGNNIY